MAMYGADFRSVGGMEDTNSGRWGFEDTAFLHKVQYEHKGDWPCKMSRLPQWDHEWGGLEVGGLDNYHGVYHTD